MVKKGLQKRMLPGSLHKPEVIKKIKNGLRGQLLFIITCIYYLLQTSVFIFHTFTSCLFRLFNSFILLFYLISIALGIEFRILKIF